MGAPVAFFEIISDDPSRAQRKAEKLGGATVVPPMDLPTGYGPIAMFTDPDGNKVGLWS